MTRTRGDAKAAAAPAEGGATAMLAETAVAPPSGSSAETADFRRLVAESLQGIFVLDATGTLLYANRAAAEMLGYAGVDELMALGNLEKVADPGNLDFIRARRREMLTGVHASVTFEWLGRRKNGEPIWLESRSRPIDWGGIRAVQGAVIDVTARKQAEQQLAARHAFDRVLSDLSAKFLKMTPDDVTRGIRDGLRQVCDTLGFDRCSFYECADDGKTLQQVQCYAIDGVTEAVPKNLSTEMPWFASRVLRGDAMITSGPIDLPPSAVAESEYSRRQGIRSVIAIPISVGGSRLCALVATAIRVVHDLSEETVEWVRLLGEIMASALARRRDDQAIRQSEDRFRDLAEVSVDGFWEVDDSLRFTYVSDRLLGIVEASPSDFIGYTLEDIGGDETETADWHRLRQQLDAREQFRDFRFRFVGGGEVHFLSISGKPIFGEEGRFRGYRGVGRNVTRSVVAETLLRESADRVRDFAEATSDWFWETDAGHRLTYVSDSIAAWHDDSPDSHLGHSRFKYEAFDGESEKWQRHREALAAHRPFRNFRYRRLRHDGRVQHISSSGRPYFALDGTFLGYRGTGTDITAEMEARTQLNDAIESMTDGVVIFDNEDRLVICNRAFIGLNAAIAKHIRPGLRYADMLALAAGHRMMADAIGREQAWIEERLQSFRRAKGLVECKMADGRWIQLADRHTEGGYTVSLRTDITLSKQREEQLRQAQKMEAIGQLTGGIAHDFNNLLAIIQGNVSVLEKQLDQDSELRGLTAPVLRATKRGASLTHRLLAFSRRQPLERRVVDVGELLGGMQDLLYRTLGEDVRLEIVPDADLWPCLVDPMQLEQAVLNMAINARDAMPNGGRLLIEVTNVALTDAYAAAQTEMQLGEYVMLAVSDSGQGMSPDIASRIFEPFFTTKEVGKGSGLGLSMVFGFAKQSKGHVAVYSEPGFGSTFKLFLPRSNEACRSVAAGSDVARAAPRGSGRTVLLVEDDPDVRHMAALLLRGLDYRVNEAENAGQAMGLLQTMPEVDLLLTDVVLPGGTDGRDLAAIARRRHPDLKLLFMSGYTNDAAGPEGRDPVVGPLLKKPFEPEDLARMVADAISGAAA